MLKFGNAMFRNHLRLRQAHSVELLRAILTCISE
jgi:hypothetical protein